VMDSATTWISRKRPPPRPEWTSKFLESKCGSSLGGDNVFRHDRVGILVWRCAFANPETEIVEAPIFHSSFLSLVPSGSIKEGQALTNLRSRRSISPMAVR
jgi:hypothetical protein